MLVVTFPVPVGHRLGHEDIHSSEEERHPVAIWTRLDDLDFDDDLATPTQQQMQEKTNTVAGNSAALGLNIHKGKNSVLKVSRANANLSRW